MRCVITPVQFATKRDILITRRYALYVQARAARIKSTVYQQGGSVANLSFSFCIGLIPEISEGRGSRVRVALKGVSAVFHRPHPEKETDKGAVKSVRKKILKNKLLKNT